MKCLEINKIYDYLEGEISPEERIEIEKHLSTCPTCSRILRERKILLESIKEIPKIEPPPDLVDKIMDKIIRPRVSWVKVFIYSLSTSFIFLLFSIIFLKATEKNVSLIFLNFTDSFLNTIRYVTIFLAKLMKVITLIFKVLEQIIGDFIIILLKSISSLELKLQIMVILTTVILTGLIFILYFPFKKILVKP